MPVALEAFQADVLYVDYLQEAMMFRCVRTPGSPLRVFRKLYGNPEEVEIPFSAEQFMEARRYGEVTTAEAYAEADTKAGG